MRYGLALAALLVCGPAFSQVCVTLDSQNDALKDADRAAAQTLMKSAFETAGQTVVAAPCSKAFTLNHIRLGDAIFARLKGPGVFLKRKADSVEELDAIYDQLARAAVGRADVTTRHNVTRAQAAPKREKADGVWFVNIGSGYTVGSDGEGMPISWGFGYRYELDRLGIEASVRGTHTTDGPDSSQGGIRVLALYHLDGVASTSAYVGGGLGLGGTSLARKTSPDTVQDDYHYYYDDYESGDGTGLEGHLVAGYSFLRASTIRLFVQADVVLPLYTVSMYDWNADTSDSQWAPTASLSMGLGW